MALKLNVRQDLGRIDQAFNRLVGDDEIWKKFLRDPNGVLIDIGLHAPTDADINRRCNAIMFATLSNRELLKLTAEIANDFFDTLEDRGEIAEWRRHHLEGLRDGEVGNLVDYDMAFVDHLNRNPDMLRRRYRVAFGEVNRRMLLNRVYEDRELDSYIDDCIESSRRFNEDITWPVLEEWDAHYGVGKPFGFAALTEIAFDFTAFVGVEFGFAITALGVTRIDDLINPGDPFLEGGKHRHAAIVGQLLKMSSELSVAAGLHVRQ
ncbi:MAG TPA: hypothetical protein VIN05_07950 [Roseovarius sp.]